MAPPLEMLEGIVQQLRTCQTAGIWAWDCVYREMVLILVWVLALLGDNPMQSSDARPDGVVGTAHEGSTSKHGGGGEDRPMESSEAGSSAAESSDGAGGGDHWGDVQGVRRRKGTPRNKEESQAYLTSYFNAARAVGNQTCITKAKMASGSHDTYQDFFLKRLELSYKKQEGKEAATLGITPVQLPCRRSGFVPLGRPHARPVGGFPDRVAPFVLYDLIPPEAMGAWVALARLIPLVWQPVIPDVDHHLVGSR
ncbi:hypothetical protein JB92DRAFT_3242412 [Gautieria morchelliformis]|nr:hypothetical protein JB92DRAFT_3242412 [Gautieria morchelliformis]